MVDIVNEIRFRMVYTSWSLFIFQPLHSLGECQCWWTRESLRAHAAKFYGRLQLICSVSRASTFSVLKFIEIVIFSGLFTIPFGLSLFWHFRDISFQLFSYFLWLRITDDGSVLEMRIWSILSLFSYCKNQAFTLNTLWGFCKTLCLKHIFRFSKGGGVNFNTCIFKFVFSLCNQISTSLSICGLHFWCRLNLKMLPTPLVSISEVEFEMLTVSFQPRAKTVWIPLRMSTGICRLGEGHNWCQLECRLSVGKLSLEDNENVVD